MRGVWPRLEASIQGDQDHYHHEGEQGKEQDEEDREWEEYCGDGASCGEVVACLNGEYGEDDGPDGYAESDKSGKALGEVVQLEGHEGYGNGEHGGQVGESEAGEEASVGSFSTEDAAHDPADCGEEGDARDSEGGPADDGESLEGTLDQRDIIEVGGVERGRAGYALGDGYYDDDDERPSDGSLTNDGPHGRDGNKDDAYAGLEEALV